MIVGFRRDHRWDRSDFVQNEMESDQDDYEYEVMHQMEQEHDPFNPKSKFNGSIFTRDRKTTLMTSSPTKLQSSPLKSISASINEDKLYSLDSFLDSTPKQIGGLCTVGEDAGLFGQSILTKRGKASSTYCSFDDEYENDQAFKEDTADLGSFSIENTIKRSKSDIRDALELDKEIDFQRPDHLNSEYNERNDLNAKYLIEPIFGTYFKARTYQDKQIYFREVPTIVKPPEEKVLLSKRIDLLIREVEEDFKYDEAKRKNDKRLALLNSADLEAVEMPKSNTKLWVDKYKPKNFVDLVGDDTKNRAVLHWVVQWNYATFKKTAPKTSDKYFRPEKKIMLIGGPPGLGKTSIAHVVAKHCGYDVIEVNASDERTLAQLEHKIISSITSKTMFGKPKLVILDEIDGVAGQSGLIDFIVSLSNDVLKKNPKFKLMRPIICICNDVYSKSLKKLRLAAELILFQKDGTVSNSMEKKLKMICKLENFDISMEQISKVCESSDNDLRSSINTLQFLSLNPDFVKISKDLNQSYTKLIGKIFKVHRTGASFQYTQEISNMTKGIDGFEFLNLLHGCFEHYLGVHIFDTASHEIESRPVRLCAELCAFDMFNTAVYKSGYHQLESYRDFVLPSFYRYYSTSSVKIPQFPKNMIKVEQYKKELTIIKDDFIKGVEDKVYRFVPKNTVITELAPYLLNIISPSVSFVSLC